MCLGSHALVWVADAPVIRSVQLASQAAPLRRVVMPSVKKPFVQFRGSDYTPAVDLGLSESIVVEYRDTSSRQVVIQPSEFRHVEWEPLPVV